MLHTTNVYQNHEGSSTNGFENYFMTNDDLRKCLLILDKNINTITLDASNGLHAYLIHCSWQEHIIITKNSVAFFCSSTSNASSPHICEECNEAKHYEQQKRVQHEMNLDDQIRPESHCPLNTLSPHCLQMRYENLQEETNKLKQKCIRFQESWKCCQIRTQRKLLRMKIQMHMISLQKC